MYDGNNNNGGLGFLDTLNIMSFVIGMMNLEQNLTQNDKQEIENQFNTKVDQLLEEIHKHLQQQDAKIDAIMEKMGVTIDDT